MSALDVVLVTDDVEDYSYVVHAGAGTGSVRLPGAKVSIVGTPGGLLNLADALTVAADAIAGTKAGVIPVREDARAVPMSEHRGGAA